MPRRALLVALAVLETVTLLTGCGLASAAHRSTPPPTRVGSPVAVAPAPVAVTKPAPVRKPKPRVRPVVRTVKAAPVRKAAVRRTAVRRVAPKPRLTGRLLMMAAVARIPGYRAGSVEWVMTSKYGSWGTADWYRGVVYISPSVPARRMYDVVAHEWSHLVSVRPYASVSTATKEMNRVFGGSGLTGAERAADCMARRLGATWTHYTSCDSSAWRAAAVRLLAGHPA
jgi:hypothetical protein